MNWLAIVLCGVAAVIIGFLWFGPLFGKAWMSSMGKTMPSPEERKKMGSAMMKSALIAFVGAMITAFVLARAIMLGSVAEGITGVSAAFHFAFWNWLGFMMPVVLGAVLWEQKTWKWFFITAGYYLVDLIAMGLILVWLS
jgi:hypothetical protein